MLAVEACVENWTEDPPTTASTVSTSRDSSSSLETAPSCSASERSSPRRLHNTTASTQQQQQQQRPRPMKSGKSHVVSEPESSLEPESSAEAVGGCSQAPSTQSTAGLRQMPVSP